MNSKHTAPGLSWLAIVFVALALSIGWGVRGNWGHEYGAMIPGALAAMAAVLVSGRTDWYRRIPFFAFFGALGWSFGGSISYMQVIAYTHSGDALSVVYGFACLFLIGFLWGALGGAGTALPAFLSRDRLTELLVPTLAVFVAWMAQDFFLAEYLRPMRQQVADGTLSAQQFREQIAWLNWNDTDWMGVIVAAVAVLVVAAVRRRVCWGTALVLILCAGWWLGFTVLTIGLGLRMTPPRGDNWSGALGMTIALFLFLARDRQWGIAWVAGIAGWFAGLGFSAATLIKLVLVHPEFQERAFGGAIQSNWHSVLEQTFGFISGIGIALAMGYVSSRAPRQDDEPPLRRWAEPLCVAFVILAITYLNISKNVDAAWTPHGSKAAGTTLLAPTLWGYSSHFWFNLAYAALAITILWPLVATYRGRVLPVLPSSRLGKGQLFFIVFLWWIVLGNLARTVPFQEQRLITEGVIHINACLCTLLALLLPCPDRTAGTDPEPNYRGLLRSLMAWGMLLAALVVLGEFAVVRAMWGDGFAGYAAKHIRFGPNSTVETGPR
jgi:hypothetical protein